MRALFVSFPSPSHFFPMVPLAWALRAAGHEVRVASSPAAERHLLSSGLPGVLAGQPVDIGRIWQGQSGAPGAAAGTAQRDAHAVARGERAIAMFAAVADAMVPDLLSMAAAWRPDVVVYEPRAYAGPIVATTLGVPLVRHLWGTDYTRLRRDIETPMLRPLFGRHAVPAADPGAGLTVDPCPPALQIPQAPADRRVMRYVPYNGPGVEPGWVHGARPAPRVCVTWGTTFGTTAGHVHPARYTLTALAKLDVDVVVAVAPHQRDLLPDLGDRTTVVEAMPLHLLLPATDLIVHQGGAGTTSTAVMCGVPQVVVPTIADEPLNGDRVAAAGVGHTVPAGELTVDRMRDIIGEVLASRAVRDRADAVRAEAAAQPAPSALVDVLLER